MANVAETEKLSSVDKPTKFAAMATFLERSKNQLQINSSSSCNNNNNNNNKQILHSAIRS